MHHTGIEKVLYGVEDLNTAKKFWRDFGLNCVAENDDLAVFAVQNGANIEVRSSGDPSLPPAACSETESTVREVTFGVRCKRSWMICNASSVRCVLVPIR